MTWAKLDDAILDNQKILSVGVLGFALHVAAITWCCRNLTDGFVPYVKPTQLVDFSGVFAYSEQSDEAEDPDAHEIAKDLVRAGLWDEVPGGYQIHDFLEYNPSREKVLAERSKSNARQAVHRSKGTVTAPVTPKSRRDNSVSNEHVTHAPVPDPVKIKDSLTGVSFVPDSSPDLPPNVAIPAREPPSGTHHVAEVRVPTDIPITEAVTAACVMAGAPKPTREHVQLMLASRRASRKALGDPTAEVVAWMLRQKSYDARDGTRVQQSVSPEGPARTMSPPRRDGADLDPSLYTRNVGAK